MHVGMVAVELLDAFGRGEQADEADVLRARFLQPVDRGDRRVAVASIGSSTITRRSAMSSGALK